MISQRSLPESIIPLCLDVLYKISDSEKDLIRVIVDVVTELRVGPGDNVGSVNTKIPFANYPPFEKGAGGG